MYDRAHIKLNKKNDNNNLSKICNLKISKAERIISNLEKFGIDVSEYRKRLNEIVSKLITSGINNSFGLNISESKYASINDDLDILISSVEKYNKIIIPYYKCQSIDCEISKNSKLEDDKLNEIVKLTMDVLKEMKVFDLSFYVSNDEKKYIESIYQIVYKVMKLEFRYFSKSVIFDYVKNNEEIKEYINKLIEDDLEKYNNGQNINSYIKKTISDIKSNGIDYDYLNEKLLMYLSIDNEFIQNIIKKYNDIENGINELNKQYNAKNNDYLCQNNKGKSIKKKRDIKRIRALILSFITSASMYGFYKLGGVFGTFEKYNTTTEIYSSLDDTSSKNSEYLGKLESGDSIVLTKYEPYEKGIGGFTRKVYKYDLSDIELGDLKEYESVDFDKLGRKPRISNESKKELVPSDTYSEEYYEVIKIVQDIEDMIIDESVKKEESTYATVILSFFYFVFMLLIETMSDYDMIIGSLISSHEYNKDFKLSKNELRIIKEDLLKIKKLIEEDEKLRNEIKSKYFELLSDEKVLKLEK